ncbi:MAG: hypothetical protein AAF481_00860 [Acidobacteriota bacterium]
MRKTALLTVVLATLFVVTDLAAQPHQVPPLGDIAASLPPITGTDGTVALPLDGSPPWTWRPVRDGVEVQSADGALEVSYQVQTGQPAGAALVIPPGTLKDLDHLQVALSGNRNAQLSITLRDAEGAVFSFPAVPVRVGKARRAEVFAEDLTFFAPQAEVPDPGAFDPARTVMITLLDISGFMGSETPHVSWKVESLQTVTP